MMNPNPDNSQLPLTSTTDSLDEVAQTAARIADAFIQLRKGHVEKKFFGKANTSLSEIDSAITILHKLLNSVANLEMQHTNKQRQEQKPTSEPEFKPTTLRMK